MLPVAPGDDRDPRHLFLVRFDETRVLLECGETVPSLQMRRVDQQPDLAVVLDDRIDLRRQGEEVVGMEGLRRDDFQNARCEDSSVRPSVSSWA